MLNHLSHPGALYYLYVKKKKNKTLLPSPQETFVRKQIPERSLSGFSLSLSAPSPLSQNN